MRIECNENSGEKFIEVGWACGKIEEDNCVYWEIVKAIRGEGGHREDGELKYKDEANGERLMKWRVYYQVGIDDAWERIVYESEYAEKVSVSSFASLKGIRNPLLKGKGCVV